MIVQVRGNHGSGKSTAVRGLMNRFPLHQVVYARELSNWERLAVKEDEVVGLILNGPGEGTFLVGAYDRPTGGCDGVKKQDHINQRARFFHDLGYHVVFEGILASITFQRYADLAEQVGRDKMLFGFLDTAKEQSFANIAERRKSSKITRGPFNEGLFDSKITMLRRNRERLIADGYRVLDLRFGEATEQIADALLTA